MPPEDLLVSVSELVALLNQTLEYAYPSIVVAGELANFRVSKNKWVYFDLKDELACVKFFGTVYQLPGPLEDGMMLKVRGAPRLHPNYGFSVNIFSIQPAGEGTIRRAADLLQAKLGAEGLFDESRKRPLPYPPARIGLIASKQSAAYADFNKVLNARWQGVEIEFVDVQVQGEPAPEQIARAILRLNELAEPPEALVITRGGGSAEDLQAFSSESVVRAVAASRVPTLVAVGHEVDISLAELAADRRASTPSNAAELLVPDKQHVAESLARSREQLCHLAESNLRQARNELEQRRDALGQVLKIFFKERRQVLEGETRLIKALSPEAILRRGYAVVRKNQKAVRSGRNLKPGDILMIELIDAAVSTVVERVEDK